MAGTEKEHVSQGKHTVCLFTVEWLNFCEMTIISNRQIIGWDCTTVSSIVRRMWAILSGKKFHKFSFFFLKPKKFTNQISTGENPASYFRSAARHCHHKSFAFIWTWANAPLRNRLLVSWRTSTIRALMRWPLTSDYRLWMESTPFWTPTVI